MLVPHAAAAARVHRVLERAATRASIPMTPRAFGSVLDSGLMTLDLE